MKTACGWLYALCRFGYPPKFPDMLAAISEVAEMGFNSIELETIGEDNLLAVDSHKVELKAQIATMGLEVVNFCPMLPEMVSLEKGKRDRAFELFATGCDLAEYLGCGLVMCDSYQVPLAYPDGSPQDNPIDFGKSYSAAFSPDFDWDVVWGNLVSVIQRGVELAARRGLRLAMELRAGEAVSNTDAFLRIHEAIGSPNFGAVFDTAHLHAQKEILSLSVEKLKHMIFLVHASDNDGQLNLHLPIGAGTIDWPSLLQTLRKHRFGGYVVLDIGELPDMHAEYVQSRERLDDFGL